MDPVIQENHEAHPISHGEDVGALRRMLRNRARKLGAPAELQDRLALVATELGTNLVRHALEGGVVHFRAIHAPEGAGFEIVSVDRGPGFTLQEAQSAAIPPPAGGLGVGLGAIERLSDAFDIHTRIGEGTVIVTRLEPRPSRDSRGRIVVGGFTVPIRGERVCGDTWAVLDQSGRTAILVADGLGHGVLAAEASRAAATLFRDSFNGDIAGFFVSANARLSSTRGAAVGLALIEPDEGLVRFAGVGNILGSILTAKRSQGLMSRPGIVGASLELPRIHVETHPWSPGSLVALASDGIKTVWKWETFESALDRDPAILAALLHRDAARGGDDAVAVVARDAGGR